MYYWPRIAEKYLPQLQILNPYVDPTFRFMTLDWDGRIRMDCSSPYAMASMIANKDKFDVAWACDTDHDRHGIVTRTAGLLNPNHYLAVSIQYLFTHRPEWSAKVGIGKTLVSSSIIDRVAKGLGRPMLEVPVGFKWFVDGLIDGSLGFVGEESAGASFLRRNGTVWTTDKDGLIMGLLAAEMTAVTGKDPGQLYGDLTAKYGDPVYQRIDAEATPEQKAKLAKLSAAQVTAKTLAGEPITVDPDRSPRQPRAHRRAEGDDGERLVRRAALGHGRRLQNLRRELQRRSPPQTNPKRSPSPGHRRYLMMPATPGATSFRALAKGWVLLAPEPLDTRRIIEKESEQNPSASGLCLSPFRWENRRD